VALRRPGSDWLPTICKVAVVDPTEMSPGISRTTQASNIGLYWDEEDPPGSLSRRTFENIDGNFQATIKAKVKITVANRPRWPEPLNPQQPLAG
jgi:hypothetical protein